MLSGFVLAWSTPTGMQRLEFYRRRFARIYPSHLVMLIVAVSVPVVTVSVTTGGTLASIFLVQAWSPHGPILYGLNAVAWTLSCEAFSISYFPSSLAGCRPGRPHGAGALLSYGLPGKP